MNPVIELINDNLGNGAFYGNGCVTIDDVEATLANSLEKPGLGEFNPSFTEYSDSVLTAGEEK